MGGVIVRYALKGDDLQSITKVEGKSVKGSYWEGQKLRLDWIQELRDLSMLSIAGNNLINIDLSALSSCRILERLDLSENSLRAVDLTPLGELQLLTHLDLSHNKMQNLNLDPLYSCRRLKWLYLQGNSFKKVNIAPLLNHSGLVCVGLDDRQTPVVNYRRRVSGGNLAALAEIAIRSFYEVPPQPEWLRPELKAVRPTMEFLVRTYGWRRVVECLRSQESINQAEYDKKQQKRFLRGLHMDELLGLEKGLDELLDVVPADREWDESLDIIYERILSLLRDQINPSGRTNDMDIELMSDKRASVLVPSILDVRTREVERIWLYQNEDGNVDISALKGTAYGSHIISALGLDTWVNKKQLSELRNAFNALGIVIRMKRVRKRDSTGR